MLLSHCVIMAFDSGSFPNNLNLVDATPVFKKRKQKK